MDADHALIEAVLAGDVRMAARLITRAEQQEVSIRPVLQALYQQGGRARVIGVTGPPGAGKSTLTDQLVGLYRKRQQRVAVLAVDPSSPFSGGAVLGDRLRMGRHDTDPGVFIRSMATRGVLGGLSKAVGDALTVLDAMGWDVIVVETVGVGQSEMDIVRHAQCVVLLQTPMGGDAVQASKSGVLEIGDIFVVNRAHAPGSARMVQALQEMVSNTGASGPWRKPVLTTEAVVGEGVEALAAQIDRFFDTMAAHPAMADGQRVRQLQARVLEIVGEVIRRRMQQSLDREDLAVSWWADVLARRSDPYALAETLLSRPSG